MTARGADRRLPAPVSLGPTTPTVRVAEQLARQERLLRAGRPAVDVTIVRDPTVSYGVRVPPTSPYLERARALGVAVAARATGGTGLLHLEGDLLWAIVLERQDPRVGRDFVHAYARLGEGVVRFLAAEGIRARWSEPPRLADDYCTLGSGGEVLADGSAILGGAAQHATSAALLHHGAVSLTVDRTRVDRLFGFEAPSPSSRLAGLRELGVERTPAELAERLARALGDAIGR